jgi:hypothetical protein
MNDISAKLTTIFQNVNEWLKFAEAKNAVLLAFSGAGITAIMSLLTTTQKFLNSIHIGLVLATSLLCICVLLCSFSFLPKKNLEHLLQVKNKASRSYNRQPTDNFYYFGDLRKYSSTQLLDALNSLYFESKVNLPYNREWEDLATQITINSEITFLKLKLFTYALWVLIAAILAVPFSMLVSLVIYRSL